MDNSLVQQLAELNKIRKNVLILVVMDNSLVHSQPLRLGEDDEVS